MEIIQSKETKCKYLILSFKMTDHQKNELKTYTYKDLHFEKLTNNQVLSLCLYLLEKDDHYSGNGVWPDHKLKNDSIPVSK